MLVALSFDNCSRRQNFPLPRSCSGRELASSLGRACRHPSRAGGALRRGVRARPSRSQRPSCHYESTPCGCSPSPSARCGLLFFGRLLVLPFAVSFVLLAQVPAVDAGEGYVLASREALCLAAPLRYAPTTSRSNWNGAGRGGTMRGWGYPHLKLSLRPILRGGSRPMLAADNEAKVEETPC